MEKCNPPECYMLQERMAIMQHDGGMKHSVTTYAINDTCTNCELRGKKRKGKILEEINETNTRKRPAARGDRQDASRRSKRFKPEVNRGDK